MVIAELIQTYGYMAVAVGTFLEGETVLILAGAAASRGHLSMPMLIAVAAVASFAGDQLFFHLGRRYGSRLLGRFPSLQRHTERARGLLERHHTPLILSIRFLYGLRIAGPMAIGMSGVAWPRFLVLNLTGAIVWAWAVATVGYWSGHAFAYLLAMVDADEAWGLAVLLLAGGLGWLIARYRNQETRRSHSGGQKLGGD
jgi:membrane protein DedA with SNARE-associated domain